MMKKHALLLWVNNFVIILKDDSLYKGFAKETITMAQEVH